MGVDYLIRETVGQGLKSEFVNSAKNFRGLAVPSVSASGKQRLHAIAGANEEIASHLHRSLRAIRLTFYVAFAAALALLVPLAVYVCGMVTRPLNEMAGIMDRIEKEGFHARMPVTATDEVGALLRSFNRFMGQVDAHHQASQDLLNESTCELEVGCYERSVVEKKLRDHTLFLQTVLNTIPSPVFYKDRHGVYQLCNRAFATMILGIEETEIQGKTLFDLPGQIPRQLAETYHRKDLELMEAGGVQTYEHQVRCADGSIRDFQFSKATVVDNGGRVSGLAGVMQDITSINRAKEKIVQQSEEIAATNRELEKLASLDSLTGLKNRRVFEESLNAHAHLARRNNSELSLIILDIDNFKEYNDRFGHPAGDEVLIQVGRLLKGGARQTDLSARYGGEEFAVILPDTGKEGALIRARRFQQCFADHPWPKRDITISCGVATVCFGGGQGPISLCKIEPIIAQADKALYHSKQHGRNRSTHADDIGGGAPH
ncbi:hypothetical protein DSLASN_47830 [Desulfoluna limicola]|uniref:diguanylate cyclase n=2 Tax=Desulfoluna limicola TaxID=2810562 RepID=A0ABM7PPP7_9BACT|nr:hypothetical protein DSLASN_47830 [Desulfoluna limicola]